MHYALGRKIISTVIWSKFSSSKHIIYLSLVRELDLNVHIKVRVDLKIQNHLFKYLNVEKCILRKICLDDQTHSIGASKIFSSLC